MSLTQRPTRILHTTVALAMLLLPLICGCRGIIGFGGFGPEPRVARSNPALPYDVSTADLIAHINQNADEVRSWMSTDCRMSIRMPNGIPVRLKATIACEEPRNFRLVADGGLVVHADVGSNDGYCWWMMQPGENALFVVDHNDMDFVRNHPLMNQTMSMPFEPDWLMQVLGVTRLDATGMTLHPDPHPERVNLVSEYTSRDGRLFRRVTVVDLHAGRVVGHRMVDSANNTIARASLSDFSVHGNATLPGRLAIDWPNMDMSLTITVRNLAVNRTLRANLWQPPQDQAITRVSLAEHLRLLEQHGRMGEAPRDGVLRDTQLQQADGTDQDLPWDDEPQTPAKRRWRFWRF